MNMNVHRHEASDDEAFPFFEASDLDESFGEDSDEDILSDIGRVAGRVLDPIGIFRSVVPQRPGVQTARLQTPQGNASLRLPEPVVTERVFKEAMGRLDAQMNKLRASVNKDRAAIQATVKRQDALLSTMKKTVKKLEDRRQQDLMMSMLTTMMLQQQGHGELMAHTHAASGAVDPASVPVNNSAMMFLLLPMMMDGSGGMFGSASSGGGGDNNMMMMMFMMMAFSGSGMFGGGR